MMVMAGLVDKVIGFVNEIVFEDGLVMGGSLYRNAEIKTREMKGRRRIVSLIICLSLYGSHLEDGRCIKEEENFGITKDL
jgi:hypothetical protein